MAKFRLKSAEFSKYFGKESVFLKAGEADILFKMSRKMSRRNRKKKVDIDDEFKDLDVPALLALRKQLEEELEVNRKDRNFYQLERDQVNNFWEISKARAEEVRQRTTLVDQSIQDAEEKHQVELKVYKQKVRLLLYEQKIAIDKLKVKNEERLQEQAKKFLKEKHKLKEEKKRLKELIAVKNEEHEKLVQNQKLQNDRNLNKQKATSEKNIKEQIQSYEKKIEELKENMILRRHKEIDEIETRKNSHIQLLIENHKISFASIKKYYKTITANNLKLIRNLRKDYETMKKNGEENENLIAEIGNENKKLAEPLEIMRLEAKDLQKQLQNYKKDKLLLKQTRARLGKTNKELKKIRENKSNLEGKYSGLQKEKSELVEVFNKTIHQVQQRTLFKNQLLQAKVESLKKELTKKKTLLEVVIQASSLNNHVLEDLNIRL